MERAKNLHAIVVKYLGATNTRGSRVKLTSTRFNDSVTLSYDYVFNSAGEQAQWWLTMHEQVIVGCAELQNGKDVILLDAIDGRFTALRDMRVPVCEHRVPLRVLCAKCEVANEN